jgi:hypothetical protein
VSNQYNIGYNGSASCSSIDGAYGTASTPQRFAYSSQLAGAWQQCFDAANWFVTKAADPAPWYQLDLGALYAVANLQLCFALAGANASNNLAVYVTNSSRPAPVTSQQTGPQLLPCFTWAGEGGTCVYGSCYAVGRYVTVQSFRNAGRAPLRFCALQLFGRRVSHVAALAPVTVERLDPLVSPDHYFLPLIISGSLFGLILIATSAHLWLTRGEREPPDWWKRTPAMTVPPPPPPPPPENRWLLPVWTV